MHKFLEKVKKELKEMEEKPSLSMGEWQRIQILTDIQKNILKIKLLEDGGEHDPDEAYEHGFSERRMRDSRGRFRSSYDGDVYDGYGRSHGGHYDDHYGGTHGSSYGGGHIEGKHEMIQDLRGMLDRCKSPQDQDTIHRWIKQLEAER